MMASVCWVVREYSAYYQVAAVLVADLGRQRRVVHGAAPQMVGLEYALAGLDLFYQAFVGVLHNPLTLTLAEFLVGVEVWRHLVTLVGLHNAVLRAPALARPAAP